jgi:restriction system protein
MEGKEMYWLLDYAFQEELRQQINNMQTELLHYNTRMQSEQIFTFNGRKSRSIASSIIRNLTTDNDVICDPFGGSGTFAYAGLDCDRVVLFNEWEPYAYRMATAPLRGIPGQTEYIASIEQFSQAVIPTINQIYKTRCPVCESELTFDALFFDRDPEEYYNPTRHDRMGVHGENIVFRRHYKCSCGCSEKHYDDYDEQVRLNTSNIECDFPDAILIENSRINFTAPQFVIYRNLFSHRQKVALTIIRDAIRVLPDETKGFFEDTLISMLHLGKYTDYRSKSQDNHCPSNRLRESNLYNRFIEKLNERREYIGAQGFNIEDITESCSDFREFLSEIDNHTIPLILTDPPYGDNAQYFEHAQRVHPFMGYSLQDDTDRLRREVVISNARTRNDKHSKEQFLADIECLISEASRVIKPYGFLVLYFRPEQGDWLSDLNKLKHYGRKHGLEPLVSIPIDNTDPSMRVLASVAYTFKKDVCFVFLKLRDNERRWYEEDIDIDEIVYLAASTAATDQGNPFVISRFNTELHAQLRRYNLMRLLNPTYSDRIMSVLERFTIRDGAQYRLTGQSPYDLMNREMNVEIRLREFAPVVIEELTADGGGFTFEEYVIHLASFMDNGSREIIASLHNANRLVPELLNVYAEENHEQGRFFLRNVENRLDEADDRLHLRSMDPTAFEILISDYFRMRGYINTEVIGRSRDRGVDILATNVSGQIELVQCKRYREGSNIGSTPIQRVDSYMRSRQAWRAWVITTSDFTPEGRDEARITGVSIMNGNELIQSLELYYPGRYAL